MRIVLGRFGPFLSSFSSSAITEESSESELSAFSDLVSFSVFKMLLITSVKKQVKGKKRITGKLLWTKLYTVCRINIRIIQRQKKGPSNCVKFAFVGLFLNYTRPAPSPPHKQHKMGVSRIFQQFPHYNMWEPEEEWQGIFKR